jgi:hypothetical protein
MHVGALLGCTILALTLAPAAGSTGAAETLLRPGIGIGKLRLGMTLAEARKALGQGLRFSYASRTRHAGLLRHYESQDGVWGLSVLGPKGKERLVRIGTDSPRERLSNGVGIGTPIATLPTRLKTLNPKCISGEFFLNHNRIPAPIASCAMMTTGRALTIFLGDAQCAVPPIRYQGCPRLRVTIATLVVESSELSRIGLSTWNPDPGPALPLPAFNHG